MTTSTFDVATRRVPSLALVPCGHVNHATRANKKVAGSLQQVTRAFKLHDDSDLSSEGAASSSPRLRRRQEFIEESDDVKEIEENSRHRIEGDDDGQVADRRLGERFLNMMSLMARLTTQSLGDSTSPTSAESTSDDALNSMEKVLGAMATVSSPLKQQPQSSTKSPKRVVREVAQRLPRALQEKLTIDICCLLPAPLNERQSPLHSPLKRQVRKKTRRRRRLRRRTWQTSHASWPRHASAEYIVDHSYQDMDSDRATRFVKHLNDCKVNNEPRLPRLPSRPLPSLQQSNEDSKLTEATAANLDQDEGTSDEDDQQESDGHVSEEEEEEEEKDTKEDSTGDDEKETLRSTSIANTAATPVSSLQTDAARAPHHARKRPLYHQPAWISPELQTWLMASGLFATKPRHELRRSGS